MSWWKNLFAGSAKNPEQLYKHALELFGQQKFRDAAAVLEDTARLNPSSAPVHFTLGATYSRIAGEYGKDEEKVRPWAKKSRDCFKKAVNLAPTSGGLNEKQLSIARDVVTAFDRITERDSPSLPVEQRQKIFADFMETHDTEFLLGTNLAQEIGTAARSPALGLGAMMQSINRSGQQADAATYSKIGRKYGLSEGQLRAIVEEGKQKKWPFRAVAR
jgi:hypothetical protein